MMKSIRELYFINLPLFGSESSFDVAGECLAGLGVSSVFEVVVADGELGIRLLDVGVVDDADVAAAEDRTFFWVAGYSKLS